MTHISVGCLNLLVVLSTFYGQHKFPVVSSRMYVDYRLRTWQLALFRILIFRFRVSSFEH
jgi:hypothetical protein